MRESSGYVVTAHPVYPGKIWEIWGRDYYVVFMSVPGGACVMVFLAHDEKGCLLCARLNTQFLSNKLYPVKGRRRLVRRYEEKSNWMNSDK